MTSPYRVAVVVFVEATGVNVGDAGVHADRVIRTALAKSVQATSLPFELDPLVLYPGRDEERILEPVIVHHVMEVGMAAGNGYLWTEVTSKAFPRKPEGSG